MTAPTDPRAEARALIERARTRIAIAGPYVGRTEETTALIVALEAALEREEQDDPVVEAARASHQVGVVSHRNIYGIEEITVTKSWHDNLMKALDSARREETKP